MKKIILLLFPILFVFSACGKYDDGPRISIYSKRHRLVNSWVIEKVLEAGIDQTTLYKDAYVNFNLNIKKDKTYTLSYVANNITPYDESGKWKWDGDKSAVYFFDNANSFNFGTGEKWTIYRLKEKELWMKHYDANYTVVEFRLKEK